MDFIIKWDQHLESYLTYLELFKGVTNEKAIGEASTTYLKKPDSPLLIHNGVPNAKIIIILRDPIEVFLSGYALNTSPNVRA